ncbi:hypothetical protein [Streptomyces tropicalis]|uniref:Uncharacterized protein n=1 Tax=Streptomyces tropicalis TaxID=3034234 RepID=A0ABT6AF04_9ACTN|nr:hypothetical protein [Streptomyces tropicalis]MDF3303235.1 hypothetical protein [Streptomyces tropicalis]
MLFHPRPARTTHHVQPTARAFAEFAAENPHLHLDSVQVGAGTVTVHLHGAHSLEHLAHWEEALGNCARSSDSFPSSYDSRLHYTERRAAVVAGVAFEAVAFHDGPGAYDPHQMVRSTMSPTALATRTDTVQIPARSWGAARRCAVALGVTAALAVAAVTAAAITQRAKAPGLSRALVIR